MSAVELIDAYKREELSPLEVVRSQLERISRINPKINAFVTLTSDLALNAAHESARRYQDGIPGVLDGVPVAIKDNTHTSGVKTTYGSRLYEDFVPGQDAVLVSRLKDAGAVILGKTNLPEFGLVGITDNVLFGKTFNPWNLSRTSGGSSGGSAAAVAAGLCPVAQGNDGGGSIRIPSSFCGVFGLKPTYGRVPYYPHIPGWETINHEGPITRTVEDAALMLDVMAGPSIYDQNSLPAYPGKFRYDMKGNIRGMRIAYSSDLGAGLPVDREVLDITMKAAFSFREMGCHVDDIKPGWISMEGAFLTTVLSETYTALFGQMEKYKSVGYPPYLTFMDFAATFTNRDMVQVQFDRHKLTYQAAAVFEKYDLLLTPTTAVTAFGAGPLGPEKIDGHEGSPSNWVSFTFPFNFLGQPAASVPCGVNSEGLPVGLQIVGRRFDEAMVLRAAAAFEKAHPWAGKKPVL